MANTGDSSLSDSLDSLKDHRMVQRLRDKYHIPVLVLAFAFMLAVRLQTYSQFVSGDKIVFSGNDPWYHYRQVAYTVQNWPHTMPFDPWTGYPIGSDVGQFGTLYDQILATVALIVGLGSPSDQTIRLVMVLAPPVIGALTMIPVFIIARRLHSRLAGVTAAVMLALMPGVFLSRSLVGVADHNIAEPLFMLVGVAVLLWAFDRAVTESIAFEAILDFDAEFLKHSLGPAVLAGVAIAMYIWVWPPGVFFVGILAMFAVVYAAVAVIRDNTPEPVLLALAVAAATTGLLTLVKLDTMSISTTMLSPLHVLFAFGVVAEALALAQFARMHESRDLARYTYPLGVFVTIVVAAGVFRFAAPDVFHFIYQNVMRVVGFGQHANTLTIGEAQPFLAQASFTQAVLSEYGMLFFTALVGWGILLAHLARSRADTSSTANETFLLVWSIVLVFAAFTQARFNYYLAPAIAISAAYGVVRTLSFLNIPQTVPRLETYQWLSLVMIVALVFAPVLVVPLGSNSVARGQYHGVGEYQAWDDPLEWMNNNTAEYDSIDYYGTYEETDNFQYEDDVYGVMSWWDYGHWTTVTAERAPVANPFQQHAPKAAEYLLAQNETEANDVLASMDEETNVRYVLVDWKMVTPNSKFGAPVVWHPELNQGDMYDYMYAQSDQGLSYAYTSLKQRYYESLMVRMYHYHGSATYPGNLVVDYENQTVSGTDDGEQYTLKTVPATDLGVPSNGLYKFNNSQETQAFLQNDSSSYVGGVGKQPREFVPALTQYRLVKTSERSVFESGAYMQYVQGHARYGNVQYQDFVGNPGWVKVFERVPGATVTGSGAAPNATVMAEVPMHDSTQNQTFMYRQFATADENGEFTMTVPYSTTGYEDVSRDDGYANVSVRAAGPYSFVSYQQEIVVSGTEDNRTQSLQYKYWTGQSHVQESQVIGVNATTVGVTLEEQEPPNASE